MIKNLKKVISTLAAVAILATSASAFAVSFPDVDANASYAGAVDALTTLGIVNGDDNGKFNPENTVTRAEFAKMVVEALGAGSEAASSTTTKFVDAKNHWAAGYIETGVAKKFINGYDEKTFGPDDQVTYAQAVKMLVAAIGYETYASEQGGWPSGYLAYGSSLDIIAGVTNVTNDTALTRAQCAVLIYNTLKAPICEVSYYDQNFKGEWYPILDIKDGVAKGWQTLLTSKHDAYVVKGHVETVDKKEAKVGYTIKSAENFDDVCYGTGYAASATKPMYVGTTKAAEMQFAYSEAIVQKDVETKEYTLVSITPYGSTDTVEFAAKDIDTVAAGEIKVNKENSNKKTPYTIAATAKLYVNGELVSVTTPSASEAFADTRSTVIGAAAVAKTNKRGTVTLVDDSALATNGYDYVLVTYYDVAQVSDVKVKSDSVTIYTDNSANKITWSLVDKDTTNVSFEKDGAEIAYEDLKENDVIIIKRDFVDAEGAKAAFGNSTWYEVMVSDKVVSGTATGKSTTSGKEYLLVDGTKYEFEDTAALNNSKLTPLNAVYDLYLDAMGYVFTYEISEESKNIGVVTLVYTKNAADDIQTIRLVNAAGETVDYEAKDKDTVMAIVDVAAGNAVGTTTTWNASMSVAKPANAAALQNRVIEYAVSDGKIKFKNAVAALNGTNTNLEYNASTSKLEGYTLDTTATVVLDFYPYLTNNSDVAVFSVESFEDEGKYDAWVYDRNTKTGVNGFVILTKGNDAPKATGTLAVVTASGSQTEVDGLPVQVLTVARNGEEDIEVLYQNLTTVPEGSVIMYTVGADGYVENGKLKTIFKPASSYSAMMTGILAQNTFGDAAAVAGNAIVAATAPATGYTIDVSALTGNASDPDDAKVEIFYGPVYTASASVLEIFTSQAAGNIAYDSDGDGDIDGSDVPDTAKMSRIDKTEAFTLAGANIYTFNYDGVDGAKVAVGGTTQKSAAYKNMFGHDESKTFVKWADRAAAGVDPVVAFVRVVDRAVTDVVYFVAE